MDRLGVVGVLDGRSWKAFAAPAAFLLAATIAVVVVQSIRHTAPPPTRPAPGFRLYQSKTPILPVEQFYRVVAGDTLAAIATKKHVPLVRIRTLNPHVVPTALFIGEKIRLR